MSLAARLREETKEAHVRAERSPFMQRVLRGTVSRAGYADLLRSLVPLYRALEEALPEAPEAVRALHPPALFRSEGLARDLTVFVPAEEAPASTALALGERVRGSGPEELVAHAYVRYLGDLSGGQALGALVARSFGLENGEGTAFYRFPALDDPGAFKAAYREGLDALELGREGADAVVAEALHAFRLHHRLFEELEGREAARQG